MSELFKIVLACITSGIISYCWGWLDGKRNKDKFQFSIGFNNKQEIK